MNNPESESVEYAEIEIEILPKGSHTSSNGHRLEVSDRELDDLVSSYNPTQFQAPLIISHDTKGLSDKAIPSSEFSFGAPKALKRVGDRVKAVFESVAPEFYDWVRDRKLLSVSPSFYLPDSPSNPTPGRLSLRHIAALGKTPPAIKGMESLQTAFNFSDREEGAIDFSFEIDQNLEIMPQSQSPIDFGSDRLEASLWQNLREWLLEKFGQEVADRVIPDYALGNLIESGILDNIARFPTSDMTQQTDDLEVDLSERERKLAEREAALFRREAVAFCESLRGRLTPAIAPQEEIVNFMSFLSNQSNVDFSEDRSESPLQWFKTLLGHLPVQVDFSESASASIPTPHPGALRGNYSAEDVENDRQIRAYMQEHSVDYSEAMMALGILY